MAFSTRAFEGSVQEILASVVDPYLGFSLAEAKVLKSLVVFGNTVVIKLKFNYPISSSFKASIHHKLVDGLQPFLAGLGLEITINWKVNQHSVQRSLKLVPDIKNIIAVASGKGGVGKSTIAVNLALALVKENVRVGILDADIYGPSQPWMLGSSQKSALTAQKRLEPVSRYGLQVMSMGYLVAQDTPMVWRGPMVSRALEQLLYETAWEDLDYLIVDLPPGTGDIQLTLAQKIPVTGVVMVTTPQDVALQDAQKALLMFQKLGICVLGVVVNMSVHICSHCGHEEHIFGIGGGEKMAKQYHVPLLGHLPLDIKIQEQTDCGKPSVVFEPEGKIANLYGEIARQVTAKLSLQPRNYSVTAMVIES
jgi:ATP-binding protein involved in chromosome partitioning